MQCDEELMVRVRQRDPEAFEMLLDRYRAPVCRYLARTVHDESAAEDLVQEVFLRLWTHACQWDGHGTARGWLYRIATNLALNHLRSERRHAAQPLEMPPDERSEGEEAPVPRWLVDASSLGPAALAEIAEQRELCSRRLGLLPEDKRAVWRLVHEEEMSVREAADALAIPPGTVKSRLHGARIQLAREWASSHTEEDGCP